MIHRFVDRREVGVPGPPFSLIEGNVGGGLDQSNIWIVGTGPRRVTPYTDPSGISPPASDPMWSPRLNPAGTLVAFIGFDPSDGGMSLYVAPADGSGTYPVSRYWDDDGDGYYANHPCWHPAGNKLVFTSAKPYGLLGGKIIEATYPGGVATELWLPDITTPDGDQYEEGWHPTYSPDGSMIAFLVNLSAGYTDGDPARQGLWVMDADGSNVTHLDNWDDTGADGGFLYSGPQMAWSNDSEWIAYVDRGHGAGDGDFSVWKIRPDGSDKTLLKDGGSGTIPHRVGWGAWADDDSYVICTASPAASHADWRIYHAAADGSGATEIVDETDGPAGTRWYETAYRLRDRIYWTYAKTPYLIIRSSALDGTDIQTYFDGTSIEAVVSGEATAFEWN